MPWPFGGFSACGQRRSSPVWLEAHDLPAGPASLDGDCPGRQRMLEQLSPVLEQVDSRQ